MCWTVVEQQGTRTYVEKTKDVVLHFTHNTNLQLHFTYRNLIINFGCLDTYESLN